MNPLSGAARQGVVAKLRAQLATLDAEVVSAEGRLTDLRALARTAEQNAMAAIRAGDDRAAKAALDEQQMRVKATAPLEADLTVLRAMTSEYRRALEGITAGLPSPEAR